MNTSQMVAAILNIACAMVMLAMRKSAKPQTPYFVNPQVIVWKTVNLYPDAVIKILQQQHHRLQQLLYQTQTVRFYVKVLKTVYKYLMAVVHQSSVGVSLEYG